MLLALALALQTPADAAAPTRADFGACGLDESRVAVEYDERWQDGVATVSGRATISPDEMRCLARAAIDHGYVVEFLDSALMARFASVEADAAREAGMAGARARLAALGLIEKLPRFDPARDSATSFAPRLERLCGAKPGSILKRTGISSLTLDWAAVESGSRDTRSGRRVECVIDAVIASDLDTSGISFGFIGNDAVDGSRSLAK